MTNAIPDPQWREASQGSFDSFCFSVNEDYPRGAYQHHSCSPGSKDRMQKIKGREIKSGTIRGIWNMTHTNNMLDSIGFQEFKENWKYKNCEYSWSLQPPEVLRMKLAGCKSSAGLNASQEVFSKWWLCKQDRGAVLRCFSGKIWHNLSAKIIITLTFH